MLVISDASPINILIRVGFVDILPVLFQRILVPPAVAEEMRHPQTPQVVRDWLASCPAWFEVKAASNIDNSLEIDSGEREAICLAMELKADLLLVDDLKARRTARRLGLSITGTIGVLKMGVQRGIVDRQIAADRLRATDFSVSEELLNELLQ